MKLNELVPDPKNANRGRKRGADLVAKSLKDYGAGRSILIDSKGVVIAGNKTVQGALSAGLDSDVILVETDGTKLVVVKRTDLDLASDPKAKALGIADNRSSELGLEWDQAVLKEMAADIDLAPFFDVDELIQLSVIEAPPDVVTDQTGSLEPRFDVLVACKDEAAQVALLERLASEGYECRSLIV